MTIEVPHTDDMTVRNFYKHMGMRHPLKELDFDKLPSQTRDNGAYRALLSFHDREHELANGVEYEEFDHSHAEESELT